MEVDEKRALTHAVAGITEHDSYCSKSSLGDRALGIFFKSWDETDVPTYKTCSYDNQRSETSACKELEFDYDQIDNKWYYVYSAFSAELGQTYTAFVGRSSYTAVTNPQITHNSPPAALRFQLGATAGYQAINGYFYYVTFQYDDKAYTDSETEIRAMSTVPLDPVYLFMFFMTGHEVQFERESYEKWDTVF